MLMPQEDLFMSIPYVTVIRKCLQQWLLMDIWHAMVIILLSHAEALSAIQKPKAPTALPC